MKKIVLLQVLAIAFTQLHAQALLRPGRIVDKNGNVIEGMINDTESKSVKSIEFHKNGEVQTLSVEDIRSFSTDRPVTYVSMEAEYDADDQNPSAPPSGRAPTLKKERIFLEVVVDAPIGLLSYVADNDRQHFFLRQDGSVTELTFRVFYHSTEMVVLFNEMYKQQLYQLAIDCPEVSNRYKTIKYNRTALSRVVVALNKCKGNDAQETPKAVVPTPERKRPTFGIAFQPFANSLTFGIARNKTIGIFHGKPGYGSLITDKPMSGWNYSAGVFGELYSKRRPNRISYFNEFTFQTLHNETTLPTKVERSFTFSRLMMLSAIRFSIPSQKGGRVYALAGLNYGYHFNTKLVNYDDALQPYPDSEYHYMTGFDLGFAIAGGKTWAFTEKLKLTTELRYGAATLVGGTTLTRTRMVGISIQVPIF